MTRTYYITLIATTLLASCSQDVHDGGPQVTDPRGRVEIVGERKMDTPENTAKSVKWALDSMLRWYAPRPKRGNYVFRSEDEMRRVWIDQGGDPAKLPVVDFGSRMVVAMFLDAGEYRESPQLRRIAKVGERIEVLYAMEGDKLFGKVINPCIAVSIARDDAEVVFVAQ